MSPNSRLGLEQTIKTKQKHKHKCAEQQIKLL